MRRTAAEEWDLAMHGHEQDVTSAESVRTFRSIEFNGRALLAKRESEKNKESVLVKKMSHRSKKNWMRTRRPGYEISQTCAGTVARTT